VWGALIVDQEILEKQTAPRGWNRGTGLQVKGGHPRPLCGCHRPPADGRGALGILFRFQIADLNLFFFGFFGCSGFFSLCHFVSFLLVSFSRVERFSNIVLGKNSRRNTCSGVEGAHVLIKKRSRHRTSVHLCSSCFALPISIFLFRCFPLCHSHRRVFAARL